MIGFEFTPADLEAMPPFPGVHYELVDGELEVTRTKARFRFTAGDLDKLPDLPGVRYEIIDGDLYVSKQPQLGHQYAGGEIFYALTS